MLLRVFVFIPLVIVLAVFSGTCGHGEGKSGLNDMMARVPQNTVAFAYVDVDSLRDIEAAYETFVNKSKNKEMETSYGIPWDDVDMVAQIEISSDQYGAATLHQGDIDLDKVRETLAGQGYTQNEHEGVEVWEGSVWSALEWVALRDDLLVGGSEDGVKACIAVINGQQDSLYDDGEIKDLVGRLPEGIEVSVFRNEAYEGLEAWARVVLQKHADTLEIALLYRFRTEEAADSALDTIEADLSEDASLSELLVYQADFFVGASATMPIEPSITGQ